MHHQEVDYLSEELVHFDMIVGDKTDLEKSKSAKFEMKAEVGHLNTLGELQRSAYLVVEDQEDIGYSNSMLQCLHLLESKATNKRNSKFAVKHRWPPPNWPR